MQSIKTIKKCKGSYVIVRADFNVPTKDGKILDDMRIRAALPTIEYLRKKGARILIVSHIGREADESLAVVAKALGRMLASGKGRFVFVPAVLGESVISLREKMEDGDVMLLENLRSVSGEHEGDKLFAKALAALGDMYVNEAFPVSHRKDASIILLPKFLPAYAGFQFEKEVKELTRAHNPKHPFLFIQGGAKAETKIPLLKRFLNDADNIFVGGQLANDFLRAKGFSVGASKVDDPAPNLKSLIKSSKLILPDHVIVLRDGKKTSVSVSDIGDVEAAFDISPKSIDMLRPLVQKAKLIVWNGPMGWYEGGYTKGTEEVLKLLVEAKGDTIIAGGDTAVLVEKKKLNDKFTFVSTGGGATLEFLEKGTLPGIKALG